MTPNNMTPSTRHTIEFIRTPAGKIYEFEYNGTVAEAAKFVGTMRVCLSRMRKRLKEQKQTVAPFKMMDHGIESKTKADGTVIAVIKLGKHANEPEITKDVMEVFGLLSLGDNIDGKLQRDVREKETREGSGGVIKAASQPGFRVK